MTEFSMHGDGLLPDGAAMARGDCGFLIVGGAEKAGTTSLYRYLAAHPEVCASLSKETDYFRRANPDRNQYLEQFPPIADGQRLRLESSPGYLAEAEVVAPAIARVVPDAMLGGRLAARPGLRAGLVRLRNALDAGLSYSDRWRKKGRP